MSRSALACAVLIGAFVSACRDSQPMSDCEIVPLVPAAPADEPAARRIVEAAAGTWRLSWERNVLPDMIGESFTIAGEGWSYDAAPTCGSGTALLEIEGLTSHLAGMEDAPLAAWLWGARDGGDLLEFTVRQELTSGPLFEQVAFQRLASLQYVSVTLTPTWSAVLAVWPEGPESIAFCADQCDFERVEP